MRTEKTTVDANQELDLELTSDFRLHLQSEFLKRCRKNKRYSLRAFAQLLDTDVSTLSKILKGLRPVRKQAIRRLGLKLGLDPLQISRFQAASPRSNSPRAITPDESTVAAANYQQLTLDAFQAIADWYHYAILELMRLPHFDGDPQWIAKTLRITPSEAQIAIERLIRLEMIEIDADGNWKDLSGGYSTTLGHSFYSSAFRRLQRQVLEKALDALEEVPIEERSQTSVTMAVDTDKIPEAKALIVEFQRKLNRLLGPSDRSRLKAVYQLGISLYPVSFESRSDNPEPQRRK